ncbi:sulfite oxidase heme-binding subunit YedZ [Ferrovibrio sp.]|uniref:sulfite oxidase heme-binding subunit YedZ n=1 Tax=Ferrovibrio sp. TaxID=1917215 RepID=UPI001B7B066D|nr:protein-methionine-sulfoxide reductase heme-binding subunit MsrQ [Ferrovibrio sp.]MBP7063572.1 sulfoxide reductase heme-binding subunit YedZ [Ferrovibrio sp.]
MTMPWHERDGRLSPLKAACFLLLWLPGLWLAWRILADDLGPRPLDELIHETGRWAVWLLLGSLAVTPLRRLLDWPALIKLRRQIGVAALAYVLAHLVLYVLDQKGDLVKVASEIVLRFYLTIGFIALLGLSALGLTSFDAAIRRMGGKAWGRLHKLVYVIAVLALVHYLLQAKREIDPPLLQVGFFAWLMLYRLGYALGRLRRAGDAWALAPLAALAAALAEVAWAACCTQLPWQRLWAANLMFDFRIAPSWLTLAVALLVALVAQARGWIVASSRRRSPATPRPGPAAASRPPAHAAAGHPGSSRSPG